MSKFEYTLPSGAKFVVNGPPDATKLQADRVFYEQVAAGSLVGYTPGQTLTSAATKLTTFELSRLQRGTAGVETAIVFSSSSAGASGETATPTPQTILSAIENRPIPASMPSLVNVPLTAPVDQADVDLIKGDDFEPEKVGPLTPYQVQKLLAQISKLVNQESDQISQDKGIGRYGFTCYALEEAGYVKPGTSAKYFSNGAENFVAVMNSPSVWTGKAGIYSASDLLSSATTQNKIQVQIMQQGYRQLVASGAIVQTPQTSVSLALGQIYTNAGLISTQRLANSGLLGGTGRLSIASGIAGNINPARVNLNRATQALSNQLTGDIGSLVVNASKFTPQVTALWAKSGSAGLAGIASSVGGLTNINAFTGKGITNITGSLGGNINNISRTLTNVVPANLGNLTNNLNVFGKAGGFAANFANPLNSLNNVGSLTPGGGIGGALTGNLSLPTDLFGGASAGGTRAAGGFNNTVNRATVDAAVTRFLGSPKIPPPVYEFPGPASISSKLDIAQAQNILKDLQNSSGRTFGQGVTI